MNDHTREIIKLCNLSLAFVEKLKRDYRYQHGYHKGTSAKERVDKAVAEWYNQRQANRVRLLTEAGERMFKE